MVELTVRLRHIALARGHQEEKTLTPQLHLKHLPCCWKYLLIWKHPQGAERMSEPYLTAIYCSCEKNKICESVGWEKISSSRNSTYFLFRFTRFS